MQVAEEQSRNFRSLNIDDNKTKQRNEPITF